MNAKCRFFIVVLVMLLCANPGVSAVPSTVAVDKATAILSKPSLQQLALTCADLDRAIAFYRDRLGLPLMIVSNGMAFFELGGVRLMIALDGERPSLSRPTQVVYFDAPDFEATLQRLKASGVALTGGVETVQQSDQGLLKLQQFEDPDRNTLAIMGWVAKDKTP